eukprot:SAG31_NODE_570_length_14016_cov_10.573543_3_plen_112_part_00
MAMKPAKIGAGNGAGTGSSASIQNTPYGRYFAKLDKIMDKVPNSVGRIFIRGVLGEDNGDDDGEAHVRLISRFLFSELYFKAGRVWTFRMMNWTKIRQLSTAIHKWSICVG